MCSHLVKRVLSSCITSSPSYKNLALLSPLLRSALRTQTESETQDQKKLPFIAEYLISSFGLSSDRALKVSDHTALRAIKSPERPEAVVKFLNGLGLSDSQTKAVISAQPILLGCNPEKTFKPIVHELMDGGCSAELLVHLIRYNGNVLVLKGSHSRLLFWRDFAGKSNEGLLKIIVRNPSLITFDIDKQIVPRINLLNEYGLSNHDILLVLHHGTRCMRKNLDSLRQTLELIEELGIPRGSKRFLNAVKAIVDLNKDTIERKIELLKKIYGWSQEEICIAFARFPYLLACSEENLKSKMDFLIGKAGIDIIRITSSPAIIGYSLEGVLTARYNVLRALKAKGLEIKYSFLSACHMSKRHFYERYVLPFEKDVPGISKAFMAASDFKGKD